MDVDKLVPEAGDLAGFIEQFPVFASTPNGIGNLRRLILELAVKGSLVPQITSDKPTSLINNMIGMKNRLIRDKVIKKTKKLPDINEGNENFNFPNSWEIIRFGNAINVLNGRAYKKPEMLSKGTPLLRVGNLFTSKEWYYSDLELEPNKYINNGDLIYAWSASFGPFIWDGDKAIYHYHIWKLDFFDEQSLFKKYVYTYLLAITDQIKSSGNGIAMIHMTKERMEKLILPVPPLEEQKRIVAKVDELMALCDKLEAQQQQQANNVLRANTAAINALLTPEPQQTAKNKKTSTTISASEPKPSFEKNWQRIAQHFNTLYGCTLPMPKGEGRKKKHLVGLENVKAFRNVILQLAIRGRLVPQVTTEESAVKLLEKLDAENKGSNKKGKRSIVTGDVIHHPFDLPNGWAWAKFPQLGEWGRGKSKHRPRNDPSLFKNGKWPLIQTGDVAKAQSELVNYSKSYSDFGLEQSKLWPKGTLCITIAANIADSAILGIDACFPDSVVGLVPYSDFGNARYFEYFIRTAKENLTDFAPSTAQKNINLGILEQVNIPLPPLDEQKRIVAKVDQLMTLCDQLEQQLIQSYSDAEKLMQATVKALVA